MHEPPQLPPAPPAETCYRHPQEETRIRCTRCERPICPACMIPAPVGHHCPGCVGEARRAYRQGPVVRASSLARTPMTRVLLAIIVAVFVIETVRGGPRGLLEGPSGLRLAELGALFPPAIAAGEWWRLLTAMFLHAGIIHIGFNAYALALFGAAVESAFGRVRFLAIYVVTGFLASTASYVFGPVCQLGVGASGAIFGVFGAFIAYNFRRRDRALAAANLRSALMIVLLNVFLGVTVPGIDLRAHVGGLVAGLAAGSLADDIGPRRLRPLLQAAGLAGLALLGIALVAWRSAELRTAFLPLLCA